jgi:hypothetical protein
MTIAQDFAARLGNDGQRWETHDGVSFADLIEQLGATTTFSSRQYDVYGGRYYIDGWRGGWFSGDPVRHEFADGSAIVEMGDGWDIEGAAKYSWAGA